LEQIPYHQEHPQAPPSSLQVLNTSMRRAHFSVWRNVMLPLYVFVGVLIAGSIVLGYAPTYWFYPAMTVLLATIGLGLWERFKVDRHDRA
jgi:hypothetical protein